MQEIRPAGFQVLPAVIKNIIIINVIMVLLSFTLYSTMHIDLADYLGLHYWRSGLFKPWQLVTHMFMHGDPRSLQETVMHIFFNMFGLWMVGATLENAWGPKRFLIFYFFCGIGAALCQIGVQAIQIEPWLTKLAAQYPWALIKRDLLSTTPSVPYNMRIARIDEGMVGASGAIFGVLFAFAYLFPDVIFYFGFFFPIKAKYFVAIYAAIELFSGLRPSVGDNVAHFAHLGGMLFGFILLRIWHAHYKRRLY